MSQSTEGSPQTGLVTELPSHHVPAANYADLPEAQPLRRVLGPSVLLLAGAIGSGEYVLWRYITSQVGLVLVWLVVVGVGTQYFLNMGIERYTLATGETAVTGFTRLWRHWGWLFIIMTVVPWAWPGWATGGTTTLSFALGFLEDAVPYITIGVLVLIGVVLTVSPVVYRTVEKIQFFMVADRAVRHLRCDLPDRRRRVQRSRPRLRRDRQDPGRNLGDRRGHLARRDRVRRRGWRHEPRPVQLGAGDRSQGRPPRRTRVGRAVLWRLLGRPRGRPGKTLLG